MTANRFVWYELVTSDVDSLTVKAATVCFRCIVVMGRDIPRRADAVFDPA